MKNLFLVLLISVFIFSQLGNYQAQTIKSKNLRLKYTAPAGWNVEEFGGKSPWEEAGNLLCHCSGVHFSKSHKDGKMNVLVYPSTQAGLDSNKRNAVGTLRFEDVVKFDRIRSNEISFERKKSNFTDSKTKTKSFEVYRYFAKVEDRFYIIYAWQENMGALNSTNEKELTEMVKAIEAN
jgi:hypothetical protein